MKARFILLTLMISGMMAGHAFGGNAAKQKKKTPAPNYTSVFILPANVKEGRDPFFPESTRVYDSQMAARKNKKAGPSVEITSLKVLGISGMPGHLLAIINNHSFAAGDEGEVLTASGKVYLRCISVNSSRVTVLVDGQYHQLPVQQPYPR